MISYLKVIGNPDDSIAVQRVINTPARGIGKTTMEIIENIALETGTSMWGAIGEVLRRRLLPLRTLSSLQSFKDLIDDARAMQLGTFRERVAETAALKAAEAPSSRDEEDLQHDIDFSPAELEASPELEGDDATAFAPESFADDGSGHAATDETGEERVEGFRAPGDPASTAELLKFLIDRTGYIKQLEEEDTPESLARIENLRELVNAAMDSRDRGETLNEFLDHAALVSDADQYDENSRDHPDDAAFSQGPGVPAGIPDRAGRELISAFANVIGAGRYRRGTAAVLRRNDASHGHADPDARSLSPPLRDRHA